MNWEKSFKHKFHPSWHKIMQPFIESEECDNIFATLKASTAEGNKVGPSSHNLFKCFLYPLDQIKVIVIGSHPYDGFVDGFPVASGLYLDCSAIGKASYELRNFYRGLEIELYNGLKLEYKDDTHNVKYLTDQGVFMMTAALTVEQFGTHDNLWFPLMMKLMTVFDQKDIPMLFMGENAIPYANFITDKSRVFTLDEPKGVISEWDTKGTFQKIDNYLEAKGEDAIMWLDIDPPF